MGLFARCLVVAAVASGFLVAPVVACAAGMKVSTHRQMACCMAGEHDCNSVAKVVDCCAQSNARLAATTVERMEPVATPALSAIHPAAQPMALVLIARGAEFQRIPADTSPPDCISFSALLI